MPRAATNEAKDQLKTTNAAAANAGQNAQSLYGTLTPAATAMTNSTGYDPATLSAIENNSQGAVNANFNSAEGNVARTAARTHNPASIAASQDALAMQKGIAQGTVAQQVPEANAQFAASQRQAGLNLLNSEYGQNLQSQESLYGMAPATINAQTNASPGWAQTTGGLITAVGSLGKGGGKQ